MAEPTTVTPESRPDVRPARAICRNCGGQIAVPSWAFASDTWVHVDPSSGLYGSADCYYTPRAEPLAGTVRPAPHVT